MEYENMVEKLLNEGLDLLSNEKEKEQKKVLLHCEQLLLWGVWKRLIMKDSAIKEE